MHNSDIIQSPSTAKWCIARQLRIRVAGYPPLCHHWMQSIHISVRTRLTVKVCWWTFINRQTDNLHLTLSIRSNWNRLTNSRGDLHPWTNYMLSCSIAFAQIRFSQKTASKSFPGMHVARIRGIRGKLLAAIRQIHWGTGCDEPDDDDEAENATIYTWRCFLVELRREENIIMLGNTMLSLPAIYAF